MAKKDGNKESCQKLNQASLPKKLITNETTQTLKGKKGKLLKVF